MPLHLDRLETTHPDLAGDGARLRRRIDLLRRVDPPRLAQLWRYYRNAMSRGPRALANGAAPERAYSQAQEAGLPPRITGVGVAPGGGRKEVVIENDIAWRVDAMIDFLFGQPIVISPAVKDEARRARIDAVLKAVFAANGGLAFLQKLALLGAVYGYVDVVVKYVPRADASAAALAPEIVGDTSEVDADAVAPSTETTSPKTLSHESPARELPPREASVDAEADAEALGQTIRFEIVEPTRALPFSSTLDPALVEAYGQAYERPRDAAAPSPSASAEATTSSARREREAARRQGGAWVDAVRSFLLRAPAAERGASRVDERELALSDGEPVRVLELIAPTRWQRYEDERLVAEGANSLGRVPVVHVQNAAAPFEYAGKSDVEALVPLQDELNTRLSDRAYRITMQSFKMYLGKGIDDFTEMPIGPGRMYATDNADASIVEFGGDASCPSEQAHIDEVREALDKVSGVSPIAAGAIKNRIGRLSSAAALRVTLLALLGRTERKRTTYGPAIAQLCELSLAWLDRAGLFATTPRERRVELYWPNPIPANEQEQIDKAKAKKELGIDPAQVARELGY